MRDIFGTVLKVAVTTVVMGSACCVLAMFLPVVWPFVVLACLTGVAALTVFTMTIWDGLD